MWFHRRLDIDLAERQQVARSLVALVRLAELRCTPSPRLVIRHGAVLHEREALLSLAARLSAEEPVPGDVVAQLSRLARHDASPVFEGGTPVEELAPILRRCESATQPSRIGS